MKESTLLIVMSLVSIVLLTFHLADDIAYGYEKGQLANLVALPICVVWLYATLLLAERRSGCIVILLASLLGSYVPYVHFSGKGVGMYSRVAHTDGALFFVWTLIAAGVTSLFSVILAVRGLWRLRRGYE